MSDHPRNVDEPLKCEIRPSELACKECDGMISVDVRRILSEYTARIDYSCDEGHVAAQVIKSTAGQRGVEHELQGLRRVRNIENFSPVFKSGLQLQGES